MSMHTEHHPERHESQWSAAEWVGVALIVIALVALWSNAF